MIGHMRRVVVGSFVIGGTLALASVAGAQTAPAAPTFTKDVAPIFQEKCEACHRPDSIAPMSLVTYAETRPWARSIRARVADHQMPPWNIDKSVGVQGFKNDRSLSDKQIDTILKWVDAGAPQGNPKDMPAPKEWPSDQGWNFAAMFGQKEPDMIVKSYEFTMPAVSQDAWDKRVTPSGITEPRWVRAIEIRPATIKGRKIVHHAIAYLDQTDPNAPSGGFGLPTPFMEWAVGKQGELMRPDTGKLLLPGSKFRWDIHYSQAGEEITNSVEMGIYFYPKGQEPKHAVAHPGGAWHAGHSSQHPVARRRLHAAARQRAHRKLSAAHAPARQGDDGRGDSAERPEAGDQPGQRLQLQLDDDLRLRRQRRAAAAEGHALEGHRVARQHLGEKEQSGSEPMGRLGRSHRR